MAVIVTLKGVYIGHTDMTKEEIREAENAGFTITESKAEVNYGRN